MNAIVTELRLIIGGLIVWFLLTLGGVISILRATLRDPWGSALGLDEFVNVGLFGGQRGETISSHTGRWYKDQPVARIPLQFRLVHALCNWTQAGHCENNIQPEFVGSPL